MKHTKLYEYTKNYACEMGIDIFDAPEFHLYTIRNDYVNTVTFKKMCEMIMSKCVFMSKTKHLPRTVGGGQDTRIAEQYIHMGYTVYFLEHKQFNLFNEMYFDYMWGVKMINIQGAYNFKLGSVLYDNYCSSYTKYTLAEFLRKCVTCAIEDKTFFNDVFFSKDCAKSVEKK